MTTSIKILTRLYLLNFALYLGACGQMEGSGEPELMQPYLGDFKADVVDRVDVIGPIKYGEAEAVKGDFTDPFQADAYTFSARVGAVVSLEVTHRDSANSLNDNMTLFSPPDAEGKRQAIKDDDSGWGQHASLKEIVLDAKGIYVVVLGTENNEGRGKYRLVLTCHSGNCEPDPVDVEGCPSDLSAELEGCMLSKFEQAYSRPDALAACEERLIDHFGDNCDFGAFPAEWCHMGQETFEATVLPACMQIMKDQYPAPSIEECDDRVYDRLVECIGEAQRDLEKTRPEAIDFCTDAISTLEIFKQVCEQTSGAPEWCTQGYGDYFAIMIPDCKSTLKQPIDP